MEEPHQRVQSGKLRPSRRSNSESSILVPRKSRIVNIGIESSTKLEVGDPDDILDCYAQTPTDLSETHIDLLTKVAKGFGITDKDAVDKYWRRTWNIGTWCIGSNVTLSINIMQPNISSSWAIIFSNEDEEIERVAQRFKEENLARSTCNCKRIGKGYQLQGRWTFAVLEHLVSTGTIKKDSVRIDSVNIGQSRIFCWLLIGNTSEYLCTLTKDSVELLMKYIPDWCADLKESSSAGDTTLRMKNPAIANDSTQLGISTEGWLRYQGRIDNISKLPEALGIALRSIVTSRQLKAFLESMEYKEVPIDL